jgi:hypothetical protein
MDLRTQSVETPCDEETAEPPSNEIRDGGSVDSLFTGKVLREERLRRMTPERRASYERIKKLRDEIGPVDFHVVKAIRKLREVG